MDEDFQYHCLVWQRYEVQWNIELLLDPSKSLRRAALLYGSSHSCSSTKFVVVVASKFFMSITECELEKILLVTSEIKTGVSRTPVLISPVNLHTVSSPQACFLGIVFNVVLLLMHSTKIFLLISLCMHGN